MSPSIDREKLEGWSRAERRGKWTSHVPTVAAKRGRPNTFRNCNLAKAKSSKLNMEIPE